MFICQVRMFHDIKIAELDINYIDDPHPDIPKPGPRGS